MSISRLKLQFPLTAAGTSLREHRLEQRPLRRLQDFTDRNTNDSFMRHLQHVRETAITIENRAIAAQAQCSLMHALDQCTISMVGAFQCKNSFPIDILDDQSID